MKKLHPVDDSSYDQDEGGVNRLEECTHIIMVRRLWTDCLDLSRHA